MRNTVVDLSSVTDQDAVDEPIVQVVDTPGATPELDYVEVTASDVVKMAHRIEGLEARMSDTAPEGGERASDADFYHSNMCSRDDLISEITTAKARIAELEAQVKDRIECIEGLDRVCGELEARAEGGGREARMVSCELRERDGASR